MMAKRKKKKIHRLNISEITDQDSAEPESQTSSQEEDSIQEEETTTLTSKRKPNTISPLENQDGELHNNTESNLKRPQYLLERQPTFNRR